MNKKFFSIGSRAVTLLYASLLTTNIAESADLLSILNFPPPGKSVDRTGKDDVSQALIDAILAANNHTSNGEPACVYVPPGIYRIVSNPPQFDRAGCIKGEGPSQSIIQLDPKFSGDLFTWSESWAVSTPGPRASGLKIKGNRQAESNQNIFVFYDRNDQVFLDDIDVENVPGRAIYAGAKKHTKYAYMRESHMRSLRFFNDGFPGVPVVEFSSSGDGQTDATNEIHLSQIDIYGPHGPGLVIRNAGDGVVRYLTINSLRIEGTENGLTKADLLVIGDSKMRGRIADLAFTSIELIDPYSGFAALRVTAAPDAQVPYGISVQGTIGGGLPHGSGLVLEANRSSSYHMTAIHTYGPNVELGSRVSDVLLNGDGHEKCWTFLNSGKSVTNIRFPAFIPAFGNNDAAAPQGDLCPDRKSERRQ